MQGGKFPDARFLVPAALKHSTVTPRAIQNNSV